MTRRRTLVQRGGQEAKRVPVRPFCAHAVDFVWNDTRQDEWIVSAQDVAGLFADLIVQAGCSVGLHTTSVRGTTIQRVWVGDVGDGASNTERAGCGDRHGVVRPPAAEAGAQARTVSAFIVSLQPAAPGTDATTLAVADIPWRAHGTPLGQWPGADGPVALGILAWMYGRDPGAARRLLENRLALRGRTVVGTTLRLFELGWRLAPDWAPFRCDGSDLLADEHTRQLATHRPRSAAEGRERPHADTARGGLDTVTGGQALALAALAAGLINCAPLPAHPLAGDFASAFCEGGGFVHRQLGDPSARSSRSGTPHAGPWLRMEVAGELKEDAPGLGPAVTVRVERVPEDEGLSLPGETAPLTGGSPLRPSPVVLAPTTVEQCFEFVRLAARIANEWEQDVTVLVDAAFMTKEDVCPTGARGARGGRAGLPIAGPVDVVAVSPMNCRAFAPSLWMDSGGGKAIPPVRPGSSSRPLPGGNRRDVQKAASRQRTTTEAAREAVEDLLARLGAGQAGPEALLPSHHLVGDDEGDVLLVGWGATRSTVERVVTRLRRQGMSVSALHVTSLQPMGRLHRLLGRFRRIVAVDVAIDPAGVSMRLRQAKWMLRGVLLSSADEPSGAGLPAGTESTAAPVIETWMLPSTAAAMGSALHRRLCVVLSHPDFRGVDGVKTPSSNIMP